VAVGIDDVDVAVSGAVGGVGDRAPVWSPGQCAELDGPRWVACHPVVVASVGTDHVDAFAVRSAVEDVPSVRGPGEPVFVVCVARDEVEVASTSEEPPTPSLISLLAARIAFVSGRNLDAVHQIWVMNADGSNRHQLTK
jgi:hypothetical protein